MLKAITTKHLHRDYRIFLFGSQAGLADLIRTDIDVGFDAGKSLDLKTFSKIYNERKDRLIAKDKI